MIMALLTFGVPIMTNGAKDGNGSVSAAENRHRGCRVLHPVHDDGIALAIGVDCAAIVGGSASERHVMHLDEVASVTLDIS
mmetsp:Transcript_10796/g.19577  ORF Transcript_10796/g.19577 Transcript_10796/m.19577 type:complete len:81 (+) Transcript_10796:147-389(+)